MKFEELPSGREYVENYDVSICGHKLFRTDISIELADMLIEKVKKEAYNAALRYAAKNVKNKETGIHGIIDKESILKHLVP